MMITLDQVKQCLPRNKDPKRVTDALNQLLHRYEINTPERVAGFLAQCGHESADFTKMVENLNYSAKGLLTVFSKYFDTNTANKYARKPEMIANRVYANRMGNGAESTGDGWKYRGRGVIQLTGRDNYVTFAKAINIDLTQSVKYLETLEGAIESGCWFWKVNGLNQIADKKDIKLMTRRINGGFHGLNERSIAFDRNLIILN